MDDWRFLHWEDSGGDAGLVASQLLQRARDLVAFGWCQGVEARDAAGLEVEPWSATACHWSLLGAIVASLDPPVTAAEESLPLSELALALAALAEVVVEASLAAWNDDALRSQAEVVRTLEQARAQLPSLGR